MKIFDSTFTNKVCAFVYFANGSDIFVDSDFKTPLYMEELEKSMILPVYIQKMNGASPLQTRVSKFVKTADAIQITAGANTYDVHPQSADAVVPVEDDELIFDDIPYIPPSGS